MSNKDFYNISFFASLIGLILIFLDFGFDKTLYIQYYVTFTYLVIMLMGIVSTYLRYKSGEKSLSQRHSLFDIISVGFSLFVIFLHLFILPFVENESVFHDDLWVKIAVALTFLREFSELQIDLKTTRFNPAQMFILSFIVLIILGMSLLMLPNATKQEFHIMDALFTATSAVCVTGLIVVDTATYFTKFGQAIILLLIQIGGIGILTFASYFSYFFKGESSYGNQLTLSELTGNSRKIGSVFHTMKNIITITLTIEGISALLIFFSVQQQIPEWHNRLFFSIFHAISAFCNAGFSTMTNNAYEVGFRTNYLFQLILIFSFVFGGLGFALVDNIVSYLKYKLHQLFLKKNQVKYYRPWVITINSRIALVTTFILIVVGFIAFYGFEYNHSLAEHHGFGKFVTALFGATTPRTAGFNSVDMAALQFPTLMITFLLMWIGASPASTGGGIKTSTIAVATLNIWNIAKGRERIEVFRREISQRSVRRAFATISLSLIVIGLGVSLISIFDPEKGLLNIAFECFSAYSTVGLSLGVTGELSFDSKIILIIIMFIGRVSMLNVLIALLNRDPEKNYRYPLEEVTIN